jgi:1-acyl-sn-glycerol-3-phosphate acyltransferase
MLKAAFLERVDGLAAACDAYERTLGDAEFGPSPESQLRREALVFELAQLRCAAEAEHDEKTCARLDAVRAQLRVHPPAAGLLHLGVVWRVATTAVVVLLGSLMLLFAAPLRLANPPLRRLGIPNGFLPSDLLIFAWTSAVLAAAGIRVRVEGSVQQCWRQVRPGGYLIVYNHSSNLDPYIAFACTGLLAHCGAPKFVGKRSLFSMPIVGWMMAAMGNLAIDRGSHVQAVATMSTSAAKVLARGRSIAVAPEGTRTTDGHLVLPFKKGAFHLAQKAEATLLPLAIHGAYALWPRGELFPSSGTVTVRPLPPHPPHEGGEAKHDSSRLALQDQYVQHFGPAQFSTAPPLTALQRLAQQAVVLASLVVFALAWRGAAGLAARSGLEARGVLLLAGLASLAAWAAVHHCI